jgi:hypothetical protein
VEKKVESEFDFEWQAQLRRWISYDQVLLDSNLALAAWLY